MKMIVATYNCMPMDLINIFLLLSNKVNMFRFSTVFAKRSDVVLRAIYIMATFGEEKTLLEAIPLVQGEIWNLLRGRVHQILSSDIWRPHRSIVRI